MHPGPSDTDARFSGLLLTTEQHLADIAEKQFVNPVRRLEVASKIEARIPKLQGGKFRGPPGLQFDSYCVPGIAATNSARKVGRVGK